MSTHLAARRATGQSDVRDSAPMFNAPDGRGNAFAHTPRVNDHDTEGDWVCMSISERQTVVNELYETIERYRKYNASTDQWVNCLGVRALVSGLVSPMILDDLP